MRAKLLKGYPVVDLDDGSLLGKVQDLTIDQADKRVEGLLVGEKSLLREKMQTIDYRQVYNIGKDVLIIKSAELLGEKERPQEELLKYDTFTGNSIISSEGNYIAKVQDFTFSPESGKIENLLLHDFKDREKSQKNVYLSIEGVLKLGKDYVIARENYASYLQEDLKGEEEPGRFKIPVYSLEMRAIDFALGKEAARTVKDAQGETIVEKGEKITDAIIDKAHLSGKLYQVLFAAGVGELLESVDYTVEKLDKGSNLLLQAWQNLKSKSRYILRGPMEEKETGKTRLPSDFMENIKEVWGRLETELGKESKELTQEAGDKMKQYALHKTAHYTVKDNQGNPLVEQGEKITPEIIQAAEADHKVTAIFLATLTKEIEESLNHIGDKISGIFR